MTNLQLTAMRLEAATCPEDIFGSDVKKMFHYLARIVHPDFNSTEPILAQATTASLLSLKTVADARLTDGTYGKNLPLVENIPISIGAYSVGRKPLVGDIADIYLSVDDAVKVARNADDNDLMRAEQYALGLVGKKVKGPVVKGFPVMTEHFLHRGREVNVLEAVPQGFVTAEYIHGKLPQVPGQALVWMFKRILSVLDWTHHLGLVHGAMLPCHVLFYPDNDGTTTNPHPYKHTARVVDWCYSVKYEERTRLSSWVPRWEAHYPPELLLKQSVSPASDIYMAAALIMYLSDGKALTGGLEKPLSSILVKCMQPDIAKRYQSCGEVFAAWVKAAEHVYGTPKWVDFNL